MVVVWASTLHHYPPLHLPNGFSHYSQLNMSGSFFVKPTAIILSMQHLPVLLYICTSVHPYFCTTVLLYPPHISPLHVYYVSNVHSSLLHLGSKLSFSTLYIVLVGAVPFRAFSNIWALKVLWRGAVALGLYLEAGGAGLSWGGELDMEVSLSVEAAPMWVSPTH